MRSRLPEMCWRAVARSMLLKKAKLPPVASRHGPAGGDGLLFLRENLREERLHMCPGAVIRRRVVADVADHAVRRRQRVRARIGEGVHRARIADELIVKPVSYTHLTL